mmetsp:Transcript_95537/g.274082  ORF Transcript_95537/g.274082 Transcript_95537/m.274082 type:complete len:466 (-) Transcript_95537:57-1454(-)
MLRGELAHILAGHELAAHGAYDLRGQQLPQVEVTDKLHVGQHAVLSPLPARLEILSCVQGLLLLGGLQTREQLLELVLADVEHRGLESDGFATVQRRELGEDRLQAEDQVGVGLAIVRLGQSFLEDQLDDCLELLSIRDLHRADFMHDGGDVLGADLVQQTLHLPLQLVAPGELAEHLRRAPRRRVQRVPATDLPIERRGLTDRPREVPTRRGHGRALARKRRRHLPHEDPLRSGRGGRDLARYANLRRLLPGHRHCGLERVLAREGRGHLARHRHLRRRVGGPEAGCLARGGLGPQRDPEAEQVLAALEEGVVAIVVVVVRVVVRTRGRVQPLRVGIRLPRGIRAARPLTNNLLLRAKRPHRFHLLARARALRLLLPCKVNEHRQLAGAQIQHRRPCGRPRGHLHVEGAKHRDIAAGTHLGQTLETPCHDERSTNPPGKHIVGKLLGQGARNFRHRSAKMGRDV